MESGKNGKTRHNLEDVVAVAKPASSVTRSELIPGDVVTVETENSTYRLETLTAQAFVVSGGWFKSMNLHLEKIKINGCTLGGTTINKNIVAACGFFIEFENGVTTSRIQRITISRGQLQNS